MHHEAKDIRIGSGHAVSPRDCWYVAAFSREVEQGKLLGRTILDDPIVLFRDSSGQVVALFDRCPHRGMPLSMGVLTAEGRVQCVYHGFEFGSDGRCRRIPSQDSIPPRMAVQRYPVVEKWKWIWIWMGDPAHADPSLIPDHHYLGLENQSWYGADSLYLRVACNYLLAMENLTDATHISYLHHGMIDDGNVASHPYRLEEKDRNVRIIREFENEPQGALLAQRYGFDPGERLNRTLLLETFTPSLCNVSIKYVTAQRPQDPPKITHLIVAVTPETMRSTHQFVATAATFARPGDRDDAGLRKLLMEDVVAMEAIQSLYDRLGPDRCPEIGQNADEGAYRVRRLIAQMVERERSVV